MWLLCCSYNPHKPLIADHLQKIQNVIDPLSQKYENMILMGDYNAEINEGSMSHFCQNYTLSNLIKTSTCYKNAENPTCIDLILTNKPRLFLKSAVIETGLSDFHKMTLVIMKTHFAKQKPSMVKYRDYKTFSNDLFGNSLLKELSP